MPKVTLDREAFKALASDARLEILRTLDGKKMSLKDISKQTDLSKATLHEHLTKLAEAGLVKRKEREGHKWVYYKLSWKGESLLHPENARIVVLFGVTFVALWSGFIQLLWYASGKVLPGGFSGLPASDHYLANEGNGNWTVPAGNQTGVMDSISRQLDSMPENSQIVLEKSDGMLNVIYQDPLLLYIAVGCFIVFTIFLAVAVWRLWKNTTPRL